MAELLLTNVVRLTVSNWPEADEALSQIASEE